MICIANKNDDNAIYNLFMENNIDIDSNWENIHKNCTYNIYVYKKSSKVVGCIITTIKDLICNNMVLSISYLVVDKEHQRKGIGQELLSYVTQRNNANVFYICTRKSNTKALKLYMKNNFKIVDNVTYQEDKFHDEEKGYRLKLYRGVEMNNENNKSIGSDLLDFVEKLYFTYGCEYFLEFPEYEKSKIHSNFNRYIVLAHSIECNEVDNGNISEYPIKAANGCEFCLVFEFKNKMWPTIPTDFYLLEKSSNTKVKNFLRIKEVINISFGLFDKECEVISLKIK